MLFTFSTIKKTGPEGPVITRRDKCRFDLLSENLTLFHAQYTGNGIAIGVLRVLVRVLGNNGHVVATA